MRTFDTIRANTKLNPTTVRCPDVNAKNKFGGTPMDNAKQANQTETADIIRKHGGKTGKQLKAEDK